MGKLNHHAIDNGDVDVHTSEFPLVYNSESIPDTDTNPTKSLYDDEIDHLLELFHSENDDDILDVEFHIL